MQPSSLRPLPPRPSVLPAPAKRDGSRFPIAAVLAALLVLSLGTCGFLLYKVTKGAGVAVQGEAAQQDEVAALIAEVGMLIRLPEGETPTVATVSDPEKLKDQAFFLHAKEGDKVLIYSASKKAVLYSPAEGRVIEVAPIDLAAEEGITP